MPSVYAESDDGGVELPEHITSENNHDAARRVEAGSGPDSSGPGNPEDISKHNGSGEGSKLKSLVATIMGFCRQN